MTNANAAGPSIYVEATLNLQEFFRRPKAVAFTAVLALGLGGLAIASAERALGPNPTPTFQFANPNEPATHAGFAPVVKRVLPAVVNISSTKVVKAPAGMEQGDPSDLFRQFFGGGDDGSGQPGMPRQPRQQREPRGQREQGLGSGVIVSPEGYILTNNHVIDGATDIQVTLSDKREFKARLIGTDPKTDVAILKIDAGTLPSIVIGDSSKVQVGDYALAIGDPFGVGQTVTMGIVSAKGRTHLGIEDYEDFIQTDAPINPGNSGGALVNDRGELVGINTAIIAHGSEGNQGIGFAVPVNLARTVMDQILKTGKVTRAYIGIVPQDMTPAMARAFGDKDLSGALVGDVSPNSPAAKAGLQKGDIIISMNGKPVNDSNDLRMTVSMMAPGSRVDLKVTRDGAVRDIPVTLEEMPGTQAELRQKSDGTKSSLSGVSVQDLDSETARQFRVPANTQGVVVTDINPSSAAADSGLMPGDVIQQVNRQPVKNTADFDRAMGASKDETLLLVNRQGTTMYVAV
ncbi:MAG: DegQ family serine endoprotease [Bryobacteraceae bacterium]